MLLRDVGGFARSSFIEIRFLAGRIAPVRMSSAMQSISAWRMSSALPLGVVFFFFTAMLIGQAYRLQSRRPLTAYGCKITLVRFGSRL